MSSLAITENKVAQISVNGRLVAFNSCPVCNGSRTCDRCKGAGTYKHQHSDGKWVDAQCFCGHGKCLCCFDHVKVLDSVAQELSSNQLGLAEASLQRALNVTVESERNTKSNWQLGGMGAGAVAGTLIFPGVGTVIGALAGRMFGEKVGESEGPATVNWKRSDLFFTLGIVYHLTGRAAEAHRSWIQALTLNENHMPSKLALAGGS